MADQFPNPYESTGYYAAEAPTQHRGEKPYPLFPRVMFIVDLVFVGLRLIAVGFGVLGIMMAADGANVDPTMNATGIWEVATGAAMVVFGLVANIMMLCKIKEGAYVAIPKVLAVFGSYVVTAWQVSFMMAAIDRFPEGSPERIGGTVGLVIAGVFVIIRVGLLIAWVVATFQFFQWASDRKQNDPFQTKY